MNELKKRCANIKCKELLPVSAFGVNRQSIDGLHYYCKECAAEKQRVWAYNHPERLKEAKRNYRQRIVQRNREREEHGSGTLQPA